MVPPHLLLPRFKTLKRNYKSQPYEIGAVSYVFPWSDQSNCEECRNAVCDRRGNLLALRNSDVVVEFAQVGGSPRLCGRARVAAAVADLRRRQVRLGLTLPLNPKSLTSRSYFAA